LDDHVSLRATTDTKGGVSREKGYVPFSARVFPQAEGLLSDAQRLLRQRATPDPSDVKNIPADRDQTACEIYAGYVPVFLSFHGPTSLDKLKIVLPVSYLL
jgi:hypothetical protein